jgi:hypothetical protein
MLMPSLLSLAGSIPKASQPAMHLQWASVQRFFRLQWASALLLQREHSSQTNEVRFLSLQYQYKS